MTAMTYSHTRDPFRFLDLPKDIRLIVYEQLPIVTRHSTICMAYTPDYNGTSTLVLRLLPLAILRVCWTIYHEAHAMLKPKMLEILAHAPQIMVPSTDLPRMQDGFAQFLRILETTCDLPVPATLPSDGTIFRQTTRVSPAWCAALNAHVVPVGVRPSLAQWTQHANFYFRKTTLPPSLATPTTAKSSPMMRGIQILIRPMKKTHRCRVCDYYHRDLRYVLAKFLEQNLRYDREAPKAEIWVLDPALNDTANQTLDTASELRHHLTRAFHDMRHTPLHACSGGLVELEAWRRDWHQTPDERGADVLGLGEGREEQTKRDRTNLENPS
jgi:hypothetical protein